MPRQPILNPAPPAPSTAPTKISFSVKQSLIAIALSSLCLAVAQASTSSQSSGSQSMSASPIEASETISSNTISSNTISSNTISSNTISSNTISSNTISSNTAFLAQTSTSLHRLSQPASALADRLSAPLRQRSSGQMRHVWNRHWLPDRTSASPSFSALEQTWFSWYRWWQLQGVKSRSTTNAE